jgi:hypothetical protein
MGRKFMKTLQRIFLIVISAMFLTTQAKAVLTWARPYDPDLGRWITRDPIGEPGFQTLQIAMQRSSPFASTPSRLISVNPTVEQSRANLYTYVGTIQLTPLIHLGSGNLQLAADGEAAFYLLSDITAASGIPVCMEERAVVYIGITTMLILVVTIKALIPDGKPREDLVTP